MRTRWGQDNNYRDDHHHHVWCNALLSIVQLGWYDVAIQSEQLSVDVWTLGRATLGLLCKWEGVVALPPDRNRSRSWRRKEEEIEAEIDMSDTAQRRWREE
jgi:hypothetical protein